MKPIGFTGTRQGLTNRQEGLLLEYFREQIPFVLHHGDCVGADAEAHRLASGLLQCIVIHPPLKQDLRAFCVKGEMREAKSYFARNRDIVDECEVLVATPATCQETQGGTWYTINYAKKKGKPVFIIFPE